MRQIVIKNIKDRFAVLSELAESLNDFQYSKSLDLPRYKSAEDHFWCLIGARESYFRAIVAGEWQGFSCSLPDNSKRSDYISALKKTEEEFENVLRGVEWSEPSESLLASLYEHEVMHEGQLIRLVYGLGLEMPKSSRWA